MIHVGDRVAVTLETPLSRVLGPKTATSMAEQLSLHTVRDLLRHYPRRYAQRGEMATLVVGDDDALGDTVCRHLATAHPTIEVSRYGGGPSSIPLQAGVE